MVLPNDCWSHQRVVLRAAWADPPDDHTGTALSFRCLQRYAQRARPMTGPFHRASQRVKLHQNV